MRADGAHPGRLGILAVIMAAQTTANVGPLGIPSIAPLIRDDLDLTVAEAGSFLSAYYLGNVLASVPAGWMADRWGARPVMAAGQALVGLGLAGVAVSGSFWALALIAVLAGTGYGLLNPTTAKAVIAWFPRRQRATVVGLKQVGFPLGGALGALLMPPLALVLGWRAAVLASGTAVLMVGIVTWALYRDPPAPEDLPAAGRRAVLAGVLRLRDVWLVSGAVLLFAGVQTVFMSFLVLYLRDAMGMPLVAAARYLVAAQVAGIAGRVGFGLLSDRWLGGQRRIVLGIAGVGTGVCALLLAAAGPGTGAAAMGALALAFGLFGIGWNGVHHTLLAELAGPRASGTAVGIGLAVSSVGVTVCPPLFGRLVEWWGGYAAPWALLGVAMLGALVLLVPVREDRPEPRR